MASPYRNAIDRLPEIHERLKNVHVEHKDAIACIKHYANEQSMTYCDPPYVLATRISRNCYKHECTDEQHEQLIETLLTVPGHKILSGLQSPIYQPLLDAGWTLLQKRYVCHTSRHKSRFNVECLYCSPV